MSTSHKMPAYSHRLSLKMLTTRQDRNDSKSFHPSTSHPSIAILECSCRHKMPLRDHLTVAEGS
jgi:hypothetical protein